MFGVVLDTESKLVPHAPLVVVVPVYADDQALAGLLAWRSHMPPEWAWVVVDGCGQPSTRDLCAQHQVAYMPSAPGRGQQIARAIAASESAWIWILHADTGLSAAVVNAMATVVAQGVPGWGRFDVRAAELPLITRLMNARSRLTKICTGDQAMFMHRCLLAQVGGFPAYPLMEDIEVSRRLKTFQAAFKPLTVTVGMSPRRWQQRGRVRTVLGMWWFRLRFFCGAQPAALYRAYYD